MHAVSKQFLSSLQKLAYGDRLWIPGDGIWIPADGILIPADGILIPGDRLWVPEDILWPRVSGHLKMYSGA